MSCPERMLWKAVVAQAICDCHLVNSRTEEKVAMQNAKSWLVSENRDFEKVCEYADINSEYVIEKLPLLLAVRRDKNKHLASRLRAIVDGGGTKHRKYSKRKSKFEGYEN